MCIINDNVNNMYLIGAGFDRAVFGDEAPLNNEVLDRLEHQNNFSDQLKASIDSYRLKGYSKNDVEMYLTWLDIKVIGGSRDAEKIRKEITKKIANYFLRYNFGKDSEDDKQTKEPKYKYNFDWCKKFAKQVLKENDIIVNLNYTTFLEGLLDYHNVWNPKGGYSNICNWIIDDDKNLKENEEIKNIIIYKIHGGVIFTTAKTFNRQGEEIIDSDKQDLEVGVEKHIFPNTCKKIGWIADSQKPYIIPPSYIKIPHKDIRKIIVEAIEKAKSAKKLIIIGCGLRDEDYMLKLILQPFFSVGSQKKSSNC